MQGGDDAPGLPAGKGEVRRPRPVPGGPRRPRPASGHSRAQRSELGAAIDARTPSARLSIGARELQVGRELKNDVLHARHGVRKSLRTSDTASEKKSLAVSGMSGRYSFNPMSHLL